VAETGKAIFLSCAAEDMGVARRLAGVLREAGIEVWFEQEEVRGGDEWDRKIRQRLRECALFVPIVSAQTQARPEGYFRLEWHLAERRSHLIAKGRPFIVPICFDRTTENEAYVPDAFLAVPWSRPVDGAKLAQFVATVQRLLEQPLPSSRPSGSPGGTRRPFSPESPSIPDYELVRQIGRGSYGDVWLARGITGIYRAVKLVWRERFPDAVPFEREFKGLTEFAAVSLDESIQLALLHVGRNDGAGFFYYVMELADDAQRGRSIDPERYVPLTFTELRRRRGRIAANDCLTYGVELARVLAGLHARGLVHRDIKPSNVILVNGVPKLADIGLVALAAGAHTFVGTEGFVPPEGPGTPGADVYALGKVFYELSTGLDRQEFPQLPTDLTRLADHEALLDLNEVVLRACDPSPADRYRDGAALLADLEKLRAGHSVIRRPRRAPLVTAAAVLALGASAFFAWRESSSTAAPTLATKSANPAPTVAVAPALGPRSIAVLPLLNRSEDPANAFFTDGMHDDIISQLLRVHELRVVPRTEVTAYRATKKTLPQVARELGVAYLLEGTVQRANNHVRVTAQLSRGATGERVLTLNFDRGLTDIFAIQAELAQAIAAELRATLSPREKALIERKPTTNPLAYDLFLQSRSWFQGDVRDPYPRSITLLRSAVELDPNFANAWCELSSLYAFEYRYAEETPAQLDLAKTALSHAAKLDPDSPEYLHALASYLYRGLLDYPQASEQYAKLVRLMPNDASAWHDYGSLLRRLDRTAESITSFERAVELEPSARNHLAELAVMYRAARRYPEAIAAQRRLAHLQPEDLEQAFHLAVWEFDATGRPDAAEQLLASRTPQQAGSPAGITNQFRWDLIKGDCAAALRLRPPSSGPERRFTWDRRDTDLALRVADPVAAQPYLGYSRELLQAMLVKQPKRALYWAWLAEVEALLGDRPAALTAADKAVNFLPETTDRWEGPTYTAYRAMVYAWVGDTDRAIDEFARLLQTQIGLSVHEMKHDPYYLPLQGNPRWEALLNDPKNNAPL
jgi:TolB-like protein/cytochrome c-type biogenesis protein CcmH/NrfG